MNQPTKVLFIGLDAADKDLVLQWCDEGVLPTFASLREKGAWATTLNPPGIYNGAVWPSLITGVTPARHRQYFYIKLDGYEVRGLRRTQTMHEPFWDVLSRNGQRVALIDVPYAPAPNNLNGIQVADWLVHDRSFEPVTHHDGANGPVSDYNDYHVPTLFTYPSSLAAEVTKFGENREVPGSELSRRTRRAFKSFRDRLIKRVESKAELCIHFLEQEQWDLFMMVFHESHDVGHECWHIHDQRHPKHDAELARSLGDPIKDVYVAIDTATAQILDRVDSETTVFVFCSHGMGPASDGNYILDHVLSRLDSTPPPKGLKTVAMLNRAWANTPGPLRMMLNPIRTRVRKKVHEALVMPTRSQRNCFAIPSNSDDGGIRINLVGREPEGRIHPGAEYEAFCEALKKDLLDLVDADTGERIVRDVVRYEDLHPRGLYTEDLYNGEYLSDRADLLVVWNKLSFNAVRSPKFDTLEQTSQNSRKGDHKDFGLVMACGPGIKAGQLPKPIPVTDLAPTITSMLGSSLPDVDGKPVSALCSGTA